jgi:hypothetical protein
METFKKQLEYLLTQLSISDLDKQQCLIEIIKLLRSQNED